MPNPYQAFLYPKAELGMIIQARAKESKQGISTYLLKLLLEHFKDEFIKEWGLKEYKTYHKTLSLTVQEQKKLKLKKEKEQKRKREEKLARDKEALELKRKELAIREQNLGIRTDKHTEEQYNRNKPKIRGLKEDLGKLEKQLETAKYSLKANQKRLEDKEFDEFVTEQQTKSNIEHFKHEVKRIESEIAETTNQISELGE